MPLLSGVCAKLEMELRATLTDQCYSTPTFCKTWWRWSDTGLIMRAVIVVCHLETGTETEITWTNRLWLHQGVISSYQWVSSGSHDRSQNQVGHSCRLDELCMQRMPTASEPVKEISPTCITTAQSQHWGVQWSGVLKALCQKISHDVSMWSQKHLWHPLSDFGMGSLSVSNTGIIFQHFPEFGWLGSVDVQHPIPPCSCCQPSWFQHNIYVC